MKYEVYDIAIIGSGLGGLTAGTHLSRMGFKTLMVESLGRIGGRFSTVEKGGFKLPTGAVLIPDGWVIRLMEEMGVDTKPLRPVSRMFFRIDGKRHEVPPEGGLPMLLDLIDKLEEEDARRTGRAIKAVNLNKIIDAYLKGMGGIEQEHIITVRDWLLQYTENEKVHEIFDNLCAALLMAHSCELPVSSLFGFGMLTKFYIASNSNLSIANALAGIIEENGSVWANCPAKKVVVKRGKATGIVVEKEGKEAEIQCKVVISNVSPKRTIELAGQENFDDEYLRNIRVHLRPSPSLLILVASKKPLCLEGIHDGMEVLLGSRRIKNVVPISNVCPELAPPHQHLLYTSAEPRSSLYPMDIKYEAQQCKRDLKEMFPDFEKHGRILQIRPCDVERDWPEGRTWVGYGLPLETTIPNLFNVGDACLAPELNGTSGAVESGYRVAEIIRDKLG